MSNLILYDLPVSFEFGGMVYPINYGWTAALDILSAFRDPELDYEMQIEVMLNILYPKLNEIPASYIPEAIEKAFFFLDAGCQAEREKRPALMDWAQDFWIIIPEVNAIAQREVRQDPNIHWWSFHGWFMQIGSGLFSSVLHIRQKKASGKKLDKWEEEFYRNNKSMIDFKKRDTPEERAMQEYFHKWL